MRVQARIALDGGGVYAVEVEPEELRAQLANTGARFLEFADPAGFTTMIPREKVLMVQYGSGIPSVQDQAAQQQAQYQQMQQQYAQMQQQYQQMQAQAQPSFGDRAKARLQQLQDQLMPQQAQQPMAQQYPQQGQQYPQQGQQGQNPFQW